MAHGLPISWALVLTFAAVGHSAMGQESDPDSPSATALVTVTLRSQATVGIRPITLRDIASIAGDNPAVCKTVAELDVADPLGTRGSLTISRSQVAIRLQLSGLPEGLVRVEGADRVEVTAAHYALTESEVMAAARQSILKRLSSWNPDEIEMQLVQPIGVPLIVTGGKEDVTVWAEVHAAGEPLGRAQVDVSILVGGTRRLSFPLYLDIHALRQVAVAARKVEKGEALTESAVIFERRPVESQRAYVTAPEALVGKKASRPLTPGTVLTVADLAAAEERLDLPLVHQRDPVKMIVHLGVVNVLAAGEALQDGKLGQLIRVRNVDSKQIVLGRVADKSLVEIDP